MSDPEDPQDNVVEGRSPRAFCRYFFPFRSLLDRSHGCFDCGLRLAAPAQRIAYPTDPQPLCSDSRITNSRSNVVLRRVDRPFG